MQKDQIYLFYDGQCHLCHLSVRFLLWADNKKKFKYGELTGKTAKTLLENKNLGDTVVLWENGKIYIESRAVLRLFWHLGGLYRVIGILAFLPSFLFDWLYKLISKHRCKFFPHATKIDYSHYKDRLLP